jgi:hypothetical protein
MDKLEEIRKQIKVHICQWCGEELDTDDIDMYEHEGGWDVGLPKKQWLSVHCHNCGYDWSLWKLGVSRSCC